MIEPVITKKPESGYWAFLVEGPITINNPGGELIKVPKDSYIGIPITWKTVWKFFLLKAKMRFSGVKRFTEFYIQS